MKKIADDTDSYLLDMVKAIETRLGRGNTVVLFVFRNDGKVAMCSQFQLTRVMSLVASWLSFRLDEIRERIRFHS